MNAMLESLQHLNYLQKNQIKNFENKLINITAQNSFKGTVFSLQQCMLKPMQCHKKSAGLRCIFY